MKVLLINGSAKEKGCTHEALSEIEKTLNSLEIETEIVFIGNESINDCIGCKACRKGLNKCIFDNDIVNKIIEKAKSADGFIFGSPVYYAHPSGRLLSFMDRLFYAGSKNLAYKPACAIVSARRAGTTASIDVINKYFMINNMPIISSCYWNMVHGNEPSQIYEDKEGLQVMRNLAKNMVWILKCIELGKKSGIDFPVAEEKIWTNFVR